MKKSVRNLLIMLAVLVVIGGAAAVLLLVPPAGEDGGESSTASSQAEREVLMKVEEEDLASVKVENSKGSFEIIPQAGEDQITYTIKGLEKYELDTFTLETCADDVRTISAIKGLGEQDDLEKYGLAGERAGKVTVVEKNGTETELILGDTSTSGTAGQYILKDGQVYIVPALSESLLGTDLDCVSKAVYSIADWQVGGEGEAEAASAEGVDMTIPDTIFSLELTGGAFEEPITLEYVEKSRLNGYMLTSPVMAESGTEAFDNMATNLKSLTANSVAAVNVTEAGLAEFGLDQPDAQITFTMNQETVTLRCSKKDGDNNRFLLMDGRDVVYKIENTRVRPWTDVKVMDLRKSTVCLANIADVQRLTLTAEGDMVYDFTIDLHAEEPAVKNGAGADVAYGEYQGFFQQLTGLAVFSLDKADCSGTPALRVEYQYEEGGDVVEFYRVEGQDRYACTLNGEFNGQVRGSEMAPLLEELARVYGA